MYTAVYSAKIKFPAPSFFQYKEESIFNSIRFTVLFGIQSYVAAKPRYDSCIDSQYPFLYRIKASDAKKKVERSARNLRNHELVVRSGEKKTCKIPRWY